MNKSVVYGRTTTTTRCVADDPQRIRNYFHSHCLHKSMYKNQRNNGSNQCYSRRTWKFIKAALPKRLFLIYESSERQGPPKIRTTGHENIKRKFVSQKWFKNWHLTGPNCSQSIVNNPNCEKFSLKTIKLNILYITWYTLNDNVGVNRRETITR